MFVLLGAQLFPLVQKKSKTTEKDGIGLTLISKERIRKAHQTGTFLLTNLQITNGINDSQESYNYWRFSNGQAILMAKRFYALQLKRYGMRFSFTKKRG